MYHHLLHCERCGALLGPETSETPSTTRVPKEINCFSFLLLPWRASQPTHTQEHISS